MDSPPRRRARRPPLALAAGLVLVGLAGLVWYVGPGRGGDPTGAATIDQDAAARPTRAPDPTAGTSGSEVTGAPRSAEGAQGRGATTGPPSPAPACERVLSTGDAAAALGRPVARVQARDGRFVRACLFWDGGDDRDLLVQLQQGPTASRAAFRLGRRPVDRPVAGVGEAARWEPDTGLLDVLDGADRFQVGVFRFQVGVFRTAGTREVAEPPAGVRAAARAVAANL